MSSERVVRALMEAINGVGEAAHSARKAISPWNVISPQDVASNLPGGGIPQAWEESGKGRDALKAGNYGQAAGHYGNMALNLLPEGAGLMKMAAILAPAVKYGDKAYTGATHSHARGLMMQDMGDAYDAVPYEQMAHGFIDSGRGFVGREDAYRIADRNAQLLPWMTEKRGSLDSQMLIGQGRTTLPPVPPELMDEYERLQRGAILPK